MYIYIYFLKKYLFLRRRCFLNIYMHKIYFVHFRISIKIYDAYIKILKNKNITCHI